MRGLTKYEKETILLTSEGDSTMNIYTFNAGLKRRLKDFAEQYPAVAHLDSESPDGSVSYSVDKRRVSIRLIPPYSEARLKRTIENAKVNGFKCVNGGLGRIA